MKDILQIIDELNEECYGQFTESEAGIGFPLFYGEDEDGNISFDIDSIKESFDALIEKLEQHNRNTPFNN